MNKLYNLARMTTSTVGTGTITLGSAVSGFLTFANAGVTNGEVVTYSIRDGSDTEVGLGTYTSSGTTLSRTTVYRSTGAAFTGKITLSGQAQVFITVAKEDVEILRLMTGNLTTEAVGIGITPTSKLHVGGAYISGNANHYYFTGVHASSITSTQSGFVVNDTFAPSGASLAQIVGMYVSPVIDSTAFTITNVFNYYADFAFNAGFTGTATSYFGYFAADVTSAGGTISNASQFYGGVLTTESGLTTGSRTIRQFMASGITSSAAGGTIHARGMEITIPSGGATSGTNYNLGLYITGAGGTSAGGTVNNYAIYSDSAAQSFISGTVGIGSVATSKLSLGGTFTTASSTLVHLTGTYASSNTAAQRIIYCTPTFAPSGVSLDEFHGIEVVPTLNSTSFVPVAYRGFYSGLVLGASFTGTVSVAHLFDAADPDVSGDPITVLTGFQVETFTNGEGLTTGTVTNRGMNINSITSSSAGGTVNNYGLNIVIPSGDSSAGTSNNRGISISGNGGADTGGTVNNFAIISTSTAPVRIDGSLILPNSTAGSLLLGSGTSFNGTGAFARGVQVYSSSGVQFGRHSADAFGAGILFSKSRHATVGSHTAVVDGDVLSQISISGSDGTSYVTSAEIKVSVTDTVSTGVVPAQIAFLTMDVYGGYEERMKFGDLGDLHMGANGLMTIDTGGSLLTLSSPRLIYVGDSLTYSGRYNRFITLDDYKDRMFSTQNIGVAGTKITDWQTNAPTWLDPLYQYRSLVNIVMIWLGTNDIALTADTPATVWTNLKALVAAEQAQGFKVGIGTMISRVSQDTDLTTLNGLITAGWVAAGIDFLVDFGAHANLIPDGSNFSDTTYYSVDQVHLNATGQALAGGIAETAINTYIGTLSTTPVPVSFPFINIADNGRLGLGLTAPTSRFHIAGTFTTSTGPLALVTGTHASSFTSTQTAFSITPTFAPSGASLTTIRGLEISPTLNSTAFTITTWENMRVALALGASFSGVVTTAYMVNIVTPSVSGGSITNLNSIAVQPITNGNGVTSGTIRNTGIDVGAFTAAAGGGGTIINTGGKFNVPSSSAAGNVDKAIWITGNGGALSDKYALYSDSTAPIQIGGMFQFLGSTSSFPALKRSGTTIEVKLADDSGYANLFTKYYIRSVTNAITAAGSTRADAFQLVTEFNRVQVAASGTGLVLPVGVAGMQVDIFIDAGVAAASVKIYASGSETIDGVAGSTGVVLTKGLRCKFFFTSIAGATWLSAQMGVVSA